MRETGSTTLLMLAAWILIYAISWLTWEKSRWGGRVLTAVLGFVGAAAIFWTGSIVDTYVFSLKEVVHMDKEVLPPSVELTEEELAQSFEVEIHGDGSLSHGGVAMKLEDIVSLAQRDGARQIRIRADKKAGYTAIQRLMWAFRDVGIVHFVFTAHGTPSAD